MKIAIDIRECGEGKTGKGWYTFNIVKELLSIDRKNKYLLYTNSSSSPFKGQENIEIKSFDYKNWKWHFKVLKDLQDEKVDLFFAPTSYIIPAFAPKNLKIIITVHDLVAFLFPSTHNKKAILIERLTLKKALKKAKSVLVVSENTKKDLLHKFKYPEDNVHITYCAPSEFYRQNVQEQDISALKSKLNLPEKFILAVGTLEPRKNFSTLIKSFVSIKRKHPEYKLVIVGKKGWKYQKIEETLKHFKLEKDVIFPGYLEDADLQKLYKLAKIFVFPSLYEGFGIPPLEAMASGCPVVSSNVASLPEVIGEAGLIIDPKNSLEMAEAIMSLLENEPVREMLIERGITQAEKFSWRNSAEKTLDIFNSVA